MTNVGPKPILKVTVSCGGGRDWSDLNVEWSDEHQWLASSVATSLSNDGLGLALDSVAIDTRQPLSSKVNKNDRSDQESGDLADWHCLVAQAISSAEEQLLPKHVVTCTVSIEATSARLTTVRTA